jgi:hypothetical protein
MKNKRLIARLALCVAGTVLFASCASSDSTPAAISSELPAGPTLPPVEQTDASTTVVVWDPSKESPVPSEAVLAALSSEDEIAAAATVEQLFERSFRKEAPELILRDLERSDEFIAAAKAIPLGVENKPGMPEPSSFTVSIEDVERLSDTACADVAAQPSCVEVRFFLVHDGQPYSRELKAHVYQKDGTWIWTAFSFCRVMYNIGQKCLIDVPKAPYELKNPAGGPALSSTTVVND